MDIEVSIEEYAAKLEKQIEFMNRQLTIQGITIEKLQKELEEAKVGKVTTNGDAGRNPEKAARS